MIFKILLRYFLGYVNISVEGYYIERFINTCINKGLIIWNIKRKKFTLMYAKVGIQDFKKLKHVAKKTKCKIKIISKRGIPFLVNRYRKRKIFLVLAIFIILVMYITSKFVWNIEIDGLNRISQNEILDLLSEHGLSIGTYKQKVNPQEIINKIRLERDDIEWMNINLNGTNVIVKIVETTEKPEIINQEEFCNIVSNKKAQIVKITAKMGTILVNVRRYCN